LRVKNILIVIILFIFTSSIYAQNISSIYNNSKDSIVLIVTYDSNKLPIGMGTGFYFRQNLIATNFHVVDGAASFLIKNIGSGQKFTASKVKSYSEKLDIAIIEVQKLSKPLSIGKNEKNSIGDKIIAIGNPRGLEGSVSTGIISGLRPVGDYIVYQITAPISPGSSGGPVFNSNGEVLGIATFTIQKSQNLNFAMPANLLTFLEFKNINWEPANNVETVYKKGNAGIKLVLFKKLGSEKVESYSLKNTTQNTIENIRAILLYKLNNEVFHYRLIKMDEILPPGMAKMKTEPSFDQNYNFLHYGDLEKNRMKYIDTALDYEWFTVELKILSYDIVENQENDILDAIIN